MRTGRNMVKSRSSNAPSTWLIFLWPHICCSYWKIHCFLLMWYETIVMWAYSCNMLLLICYRDKSRRCRSSFPLTCCLVNFKESPQICAFLFPWRKLCVSFMKKVVLGSEFGCHHWVCFFHRTKLANPQCVSDLGTEPLKVEVKKATAWMDVSTPKGLQVTSHSCVVGMNL